MYINTKNRNNEMFEKNFWVISAKISPKKEKNIYIRKTIFRVFSLCLERGGVFDNSSKKRTNENDWEIEKREGFKED